MKYARPALFAAAMLPLFAAAQPAAVALAPTARAVAEVRFTDPAHFTDLRYTTSDREHDAADLADHLRMYVERRVPALVPAGKRLAVMITDVDMAGELRPHRGSLYMLRREIRGVYPPRIDLEFRLVNADGTVEREGRRELRDNAYLYGSWKRVGGPLPFEKALLERWLVAEFASIR